MLEEVRVRCVEPEEQRLEYPKSAKDTGSVVYKEAVFVDEDGTPLLLATRIPRISLRPVRGWCLSTDHWSKPAPQHTSNRLSSFQNPMVTFGASAPVALRRRFGVSMSWLNLKDAEGTGFLEDLGVLAWRRFRKELPDSAEHQSELLAGCDSTWLVGKSTGWTSGIVNKTSVLPYHLDRGNIRKSWSAQVVIRNNLEGGELHCPSIVTLDGRSIALACEDSSLTLFDGQSRLHGVTPFIKTRKGGYRYSIVFYAKSAIARAGTPRDELRKAQIRSATSGLGERQQVPLRESVLREPK